jgi:hypothetical protein
MDTGATFSPCRCRYELWRTWDAKKGAAMFIALDSSTDGRDKDDPKARRCISFAQRIRHGGIVVCNLFAYLATKPKDMMVAKEPVGSDNDAYLLKNAKCAVIVIATWGNNGLRFNRSESVAALIPNLYCLKLNVTDQPSHPLYLPYFCPSTIDTCLNISKCGGNSIFAWTNSAEVNRFDRHVEQ